MRLQPRGFHTFSTHIEEVPAKWATSHRWRNKKAERWTDLWENRKRSRNGGLTIIAVCTLQCYCLVTRFKKTPLKPPSSLLLQILGVTKKHFINSSGKKKIVLTVGSGTYCLFHVKPLCKQTWRYHPLLTTLQQHSGVYMKPPSFGPQGALQFHYLQHWSVCLYKRSQVAFAWSGNWWQIMLLPKIPKWASIRS